MEEDVAADLQTASLSVLSLLGTLTNGLIFVLVYRKHNLRTFSNRFVLSLSSSHLMQCILLIPAIIASNNGLNFNFIWCRIMSSLTICLNLGSVLSILLIAIDRNCAVNTPLHYTLHITKKRTNLLIASIWLIAVALAVPVLVGITETSTSLQQGSISNDATSIAYTSTICFVGFVVPFVNITCLYFSMFQAAKNNNARARRSSSNSCASNEVIVNLKPPKKLGVSEYTLRRNFSSDHVDPNSGFCFAGKHKAAVTGLLVVFSFVVCWLPFYATLVSDFYFPLTSGMKSCVKLMAYMSCILNPYLYFFRNKNSWKAGKKLLGGLFRHKKRLSGTKTEKKRTIDFSPGVFGLPDVTGRPVLATSSSINNTLCAIPSSVNFPINTVVYPNNLFTLDSVKPLSHQDSSSSSDTCITSVVMDNNTSVEEDSYIWYRPFHSEMIEVPLD